MSTDAGLRCVAVVLLLLCSTVYTVVRSLVSYAYLLILEIDYSPTVSQQYYTLR
jgi:hypothetical protein